MLDIKVLQLAREGVERKERVGFDLHGDFAVQSVFSEHIKQRRHELVHALHVVYALVQIDVDEEETSQHLPIVLVEERIIRVGSLDILPDRFAHIGVTESSGPFRFVHLFWIGLALAFSLCATAMLTIVFPTQIDGIRNQITVLSPTVSIGNNNEVVHKLRVSLQVFQMLSIPLRRIQWKHVEKKLPNNGSRGWVWKPLISVLTNRTNK